MARRKSPPAAVEELPGEALLLPVEPSTPPLPAVECSTCPFWKDLLDGTGFCRRFPPTGPSHDLTLNGAVATFPLTRSSSLCGEHPRFHLPLA